MTAATRTLIKRVRGFTYKPGWKFEPKPCRDGRVMVDVEADIHSVWREGESITLAKRLCVVHPESLVPFEEFSEWIKAELVSIETHEVMEWCRVDGKQIFDPHPEFAN